MVGIAVLTHVCNVPQEQWYCHAHSHCSPFTQIRIYVLLGQINYSLGAHSSKSSRNSWIPAIPDRVECWHWPAASSLLWNIWSQSWDQSTISFLLYTIHLCSCMWSLHFWSRRMCSWDWVAEYSIVWLPAFPCQAIDAIWQIRLWWGSIRT